MRSPEPLPPLLLEIDRALPLFDSVSQSAKDCPSFAGVFVLEDFLSEDEAESLMKEVEQADFLPSQSGKRKQHYGPKVNFNKRRLNPSSFAGLPAYAAKLESRVRKRVDAAPRLTPGLRSALDAFETTDVFVLRYRAQEASNLDFHLDDTFAYGEVILDLSLESDAVMTFYRNRPGGEIASTSCGTDEPACVRVPLPARSLLILYGAARFDWEHALLASDIGNQRTSITFRTLGPELAGTEVGREVYERARQVLEPPQPPRLMATSADLCGDNSDRSDASGV